MEAILGLRGNGFVMMASDTTLEKKEMMLQDKVWKLHRLTDFTMLAILGQDAYSIQFKNYVLRHLTVYEVANGHPLSPEGVVHFIRTNISTFKRRHASNHVSVLIGGFDPATGPELHCIDSDGIATPILFGGRGSGAEFCETHLQDLYKPELNQEAAYDIIKCCVAKIQKKFSENLDKFEVCIIDKNGIKRLEAIDPKALKCAAANES